VLCISQIADKRLSVVADYPKEGQRVRVKVPDAISVRIFAMA
jgi:predicted RNA-binding protein with RPS1 domain